MVSKVQRKSPIGELKWFKLDEPQPGLDGGDLAYSVEMHLDPADPATLEFIEMLEELASELLGNDKRSAHCYPFKETDEGTMRVRFKCKQLKGDDGTARPGPIIVDSKKNPWPKGLAVGNGSKGVIAFKPFKWSSRTGAGITLIPTACMIVEHVPYEREDPMALLDEQEGFVADEAMALF